MRVYYMRCLWLSGSAAAILSQLRFKIHQLYHPFSLFSPLLHRLLGISTFLLFNVLLNLTESWFTQHPRISRPRPLGGFAGGEKNSAPLNHVLSYNTLCYWRLWNLFSESHHLLCLELVHVWVVRGQCKKAKVRHFSDNSYNWRRRCSLFLLVGQKRTRPSLQEFPMAAASQTLAWRRRYQSASEIHKRPHTTKTTDPKSDQMNNCPAITFFIHFILPPLCAAMKLAAVLCGRGDIFANMINHVTIKGFLFAAHRCRIDGFAARNI